MRGTAEKAINKAAGESPELKSFVEEFRTKWAAKRRPMKPVDRPNIGEMELARYRIQYAEMYRRKLSTVTDDEVFEWLEKKSLLNIQHSKDNAYFDNELTPRSPINRLVQEKVLENNHKREYGQSQKEIYPPEEQITFVRTRDVNIPQKQHVTDAAWDLYVPKDFKPRHIEPGERVLS